MEKRNISKRYKNLQKAVFMCLSWFWTCKKLYKQKYNEFINKVKTYNKALKYGYSINDSLNLKGFNWHNAVGFADIRDMHINKNGNIELYIADVYDFNVGEKNNLVRVGYDRQEKGEITPYFYAYRVIIPQEELK